MTHTDRTDETLTLILFPRRSTPRPPRLSYTPLHSTSHFGSTQVSGIDQVCKTGRLASLRGFPARSDELSGPGSSGGEGA